jgi:hypothetical protein
MPRLPMPRRPAVHPNQTDPIRNLRCVLSGLNPRGEIGDRRLGALNRRAHKAVFRPALWADKKAAASNCRNPPHAETRPGEPGYRRSSRRTGCGMRTARTRSTAARRRTWCRRRSATATLRVTSRYAHARPGDSSANYLRG